jgi:hypothetical protein
MRWCFARSFSQEKFGGVLPQWDFRTLGGHDWRKGPQFSRRPAYVTDTDPTSMVCALRVSKELASTWKPPCQAATSNRHLHCHLDPHITTTANFEAHDQTHQLLGSSLFAFFSIDPASDTIFKMSDLW